MTKSDTNILFLSGSPDLNLKVLYCLYPAFDNIHIVANEADSILKYSRYKKTFKYIPWSPHSNNYEECLLKLQQHCIDNNIDVILPGDISASGYLHRFKDSFKEQKIIPIMSSEELEKIDNKWSFAETLMANNIDTPLTMLISTPDFLNDENQSDIEVKIGYPLIIKPLFGESSHGVTVIKDYNHLVDHVQNATVNNKLPLIIQTYIDGYDVGFSVIADQGKVLTMAVQLVKQEDVLEYCAHNAIEELGIKVVKLLNYSGPANFDMRIDYKTEKIFIIECNPRFWFTISGAKWQGLNFPEAAVNYISGKEFKKTGAIGTFRVPGLIMRMLIKKPWTYFSLTENEKRGFWQPIFDPLPQLMKAKKKH